MYSSSALLAALRKSAWDQNGCGRSTHGAVARKFAEVDEVERALEPPGFEVAHVPQDADQTREAASLSISNIFHPVLTHYAAR